MTGIRWVSPGGPLRRHKTYHQLHGRDELNVDGLHGILADPQPAMTADHTHQSAGAQGGKLDHGLALYGLGDDDHAQYALLAGRAGGQTLIGGVGAEENLSLSSTSHATKGTINIGSAGEKVKIIASVFSGSGEGGFANLAFGTAEAPLNAHDFPLIIDHHVGSDSPHSYAVYIKTKAAVIDTGSGLVVENFGAADGATFAISSDNTAAGPCALAAFINHTSDVHDQYALSMSNTHGRAIVIQAKGTGESIEIRRNANYAGTAKSGAHIFINENAGNYGHLIGFKFDGYASGDDADPIIQIRKGTITTWEVLQSGSMRLSGDLGMPNQTAIFMKDAAGAYKNMMFLSSDNNLGIGSDLGANKLYMNIDGVGRLISLGANDSGGAGYRYLRVPNA